MRTIQTLWRDEAGSVLSAEVVTVATVAVAAMVVGLNEVAGSVNAEMHDLARSFRSLDQSFSYSGFQSCRACFAGSCFQQEPVPECDARNEGDVFVEQQRVLPDVVPPVEALPVEPEPDQPAQPGKAAAPEHTPTPAAEKLGDAEPGNAPAER